MFSERLASKALVACLLRRGCVEANPGPPQGAWTTVTGRQKRRARTPAPALEVCRDFVVGKCTRAVCKFSHAHPQEHQAATRRTPTPAAPRTTKMPTGSGSPPSGTAISWSARLAGPGGSARIPFRNPVLAQQVQAAQEEADRAAVNAAFFSELCALAAEENHARPVGGPKPACCLSCGHCGWPEEVAAHAFHTHFVPARRAHASRWLLEYSQGLQKLLDTTVSEFEATRGLAAAAAVGVDAAAPAAAVRLAEWKVSADGALEAQAEALRKREANLKQREVALMTAGDEQQRRQDAAQIRLRSEAARLAACGEARELAAAAIQASIAQLDERKRLFALEQGKTAFAQEAAAEAVEAALAAEALLAGQLRDAHDNMGTFAALVNEQREELDAARQTRAAAEAALGEERLRDAELASLRAACEEGRRTEAWRGAEMSRIRADFEARLAEAASVAQQATGAASAERAGLAAREQKLTSDAAAWHAAQLAAMDANLADRAARAEAQAAAELEAQRTTLRDERAAAQQQWEDQHEAAVSGLEASKAAYEAQMSPLLRDALQAKKEAQVLLEAARVMVTKRSRLQAMAAGASIPSTTGRREGSIQRSRSKARTEGVERSRSRASSEENQSTADENKSTGPQGVCCAVAIADVMRLDLAGAVSAADIVGRTGMTAGKPTSPAEVWLRAIAADIPLPPLVSLPASHGGVVAASARTEASSWPFILFEGPGLVHAVDIISGSGGGHWRSTFEAVSFIVRVAEGQHGHCFRTSVGGWLEATTKGATTLVGLYKKTGVVPASEAEYKARTSRAVLGQAGAMMSADKTIRRGTACGTETLGRGSLLTCGDVEEHPGPLAASPRDRCPSCGFAVSCTACHRDFLPPIAPEHVTSFVRGCSAGSIFVLVWRAPTSPAASRWLAVVLGGGRNIRLRFFATEAGAILEDCRGSLPHLLDAIVLGWAPSALLSAPPSPATSSCSDEDEGQTRPRSSPTFSWFLVPLLAAVCDRARPAFSHLRASVGAAMWDDAVAELKGAGLTVAKIPWCGDYVEGAAQDVLFGPHWQRPAFGALTATISTRDRQTTARPNTAAAAFFTAGPEAVTAMPSPGSRHAPAASQATIASEAMTAEARPCENHELPPFPVEAPEAAPDAENMHAETVTATPSAPTGATPAATPAQPPDNEESAPSPRQQKAPRAVAIRNNRAQAPGPGPGPTRAPVSQDDTEGAEARALCPGPGCTRPLGLYHGFVTHLASHSDIPLEWFTAGGHPFRRCSATGCGTIFHSTRADGPSVCMTHRSSAPAVTVSSSPSAPIVAFVAPCSVATLMHIPLRVLADVPHRAAFAVAAALETSLQGQRDAVDWRALAFKKLVLGDVEAARDGHNARVNAILARCKLVAAGHWGELLKEAQALSTRQLAAPITPPTITFPSERPQHRGGLTTAVTPQCIPAATLARASALTRQGRFGRASDALCCAAVAAKTQEVRERLQAMHPRSTFRQNSIPPDTPELAAPSPKQFRRILASFSRGTAPGPSSLSSDDLRYLCGVPGSTLASSLAVLVGRIANGDVSSAARPWLFGARLVALEKKGGGIRPVACGEVLRRAAAKFLCAAVKAKAADIFLAAQQVAVGVKGGGEAAQFAARRFSASHPATVIFKMDLSNAFNRVRRECILGEVAAVLPELTRYAVCALGEPSNLLWEDEIIPSEEGSQQGDPLGGVFFALPLRRFWLDHRPPHVAFAAFFADDGCIAAPADSLLGLINDLELHGPALGLYLNRAKCELVTGPLGKLQEGWGSLAATGIPITDRDTWSLLGVACGNDAAAAACAAAVADDATRRNGLYAALGASGDPHAATLLTQLCGGFAAVVFHLRALGPQAAWPQYDARLRDAVQQSLGPLPDAAWFQTSLPIRHGGLGIRLAVHHVAAASAAAAHSAQKLVHVFTSAALPPDALLSTSLADPILAQFPAALAAAQQDGAVQRVLGNAIEEARRLAHMEAFVQPSRDALRMQAAARSGTGTFLHPAPDDAYLVLFDAAEFLALTRLRLGLPQREAGPYACPFCGCIVAETLGDHALTCGGTGCGRHRRHNLVRDELFALAGTALLAPTRECHPFPQQEGARLDVALPFFSAGKTTLIDVALTHALAGRVSAEGAAADYEAVKRARYAHLVNAETQELVPVIFDSFAHSGPAGTACLRRIAGRYAQRLGGASGAFRSFFARLHAIILRGVAQTLLRGCVGALGQPAGQATHGSE